MITDNPATILRGRSRLLRRLAMLVPLLAVALVTAGPDGDADAIVLGRRIDLPTTGPLGPVTVVGDSVLLGSALYEPTLPDQLVAQGWGPVRFIAGVGYKAGPPRDSISAGWWIQQWRREAWDAPNVIVNLGANDSGICGTDFACSRRRILAVVDTIGPGRSIWWPMITRLQGYEREAATWNNALVQVAAERSNFHTWDWPTEMATGGYRSADNTHLDPAGYRKRSERMATAFTSAVATSRRVGGDAPLPAPGGEASTYVALVPRRVVDTRVDPPGRRSSGSTLRVDFGDALPSGTTAVAISATAARPSGRGYLAAGPCGRQTDGSTVNYDDSGARAAMAVVPVGVDGRVCVFAKTATDIVVDLQGAFVAGSEGDRFTPLATSRRLRDTRDTGRSRRLVVETPARATAVAVNLTVTNATAPGWLRAAPCDVTTGVSNVNFRAGEPVAGSAYVPTSADDTICVETNVSADVVVDLTGTFRPATSSSAGLSFVPVPPTRMLDTRSAIGGWSPVHGAGQTIDTRVAPAAAEAVTGTITMVRPWTRGYLVAHGCDATPPTSSVNAAPGAVLANSLTTGVSPTGRLCVYAAPATQSVFDVTGWWIP